MMQLTTHERLLRLREVRDRTGLSRSTIYAWMQRKQFPSPVRLSQRAVAWRESDIDKWIAERTEAA